MSQILRARVCLSFRSQTPARTAGEIQRSGIRLHGGSFNWTGFREHGTGKVKNSALFMPAAGDDAKARETVLQIARDIGFDAADAGQQGPAFHGYADFVRAASSASMFAPVNWLLYSSA